MYQPQKFYSQSYDYQNKRVYILWRRNEFGHARVGIFYHFFENDLFVSTLDSSKYCVFLAEEINLNELIGANAHNA